jgi:hypothetical protein
VRLPAGRGFFGARTFHRSSPRGSDQGDGRRRERWTRAKRRGADREVATALLDEVAGEDQWNAPEERLIRMVWTFVRLQAAWAERVDQLIEAGVSDQRADALVDLAASLITRPDVRAQLTPTLC